MLVQNNFPGDVRVKNEADALVEAGFQVVVGGLRKPGEPAYAVVDGIIVYRFPRIELFDKIPLRGSGWFGRLLVLATSAAGYAFEYLYFTAACFVVAVYVAWRHGFDVIHSHNPPDSLFLVAAPFKLFGKRYVFDHHDLCPELYRSRYGAGDGWMTRILTWIELGNYCLADATIATNESYKQVHIARGNRPPETVFVVRNGPNQERMKSYEPSPRLRAMGKTILVYVGALNPQDGVDYLLRSLHHLAYVFQRQDFYCVVMGSGDSLEDLRRLARDLRLESFCEVTGHVAKSDLFANLSAADICVDPDPSSPLNDVSTWIKIMEYMAFSKPIVSFDLKETRYSAQDAAVYATPNNEAEFAQRIVDLMDDPKRRVAMGRWGRQRVEQELQWSVQAARLLAAYESLMRLPAGSIGQTSPNPPVSAPVVGR